MDSPLCWRHLIAFAAVPIQSYPYSAYDDDFDAAILNAYLHQQNYTDHPVAVAVELVAFANGFEIDGKRFIELITSFGNEKYKVTEQRVLTSNELGVPGADEMLEFFVDGGVAGESTS